jgi:hypothetical protein
MARRQIDVFSAGCATCNRTIELVARIAAAEGAELRIQDMHQEHVARRAEELGTRSIPAVAIGAPGHSAKPGECAAPRDESGGVLLEPRPGGGRHPRRARGAILSAREGGMRPNDWGP